MNCQCGNALQFTDNSFKTENGRLGESYQVYYCSGCNVIWDGMKLDLENQYNKMPKKYIQWFK